MANTSDFILPQYDRLSSKVKENYLVFRMAARDSQDPMRTRVTSERSRSTCDMQSEEDDTQV